MWDMFAHVLWPHCCVSCSLFSRSALCDQCEARLVQYPAHCLVCEATTAAGKTHHHCLTRAQGIASTGIVWQYRSVARRLIRNWKYHSANAVCNKYIAQYLNQWLSRHPFLNNLCRDVPLTLVPIPMTAHKRKQRGFNQCELLAHHLDVILSSYGYTVQMAIPLVTRTVQEHTQAGSEIVTRALNVQSNFRYGGTGAPVSQVLLVDDVVSTGSTVLEVARVLAPYTRSMHLFALARG